MVDQLFRRLFRKEDEKDPVSPAETNPPRPLPREGGRRHVVRLAKEGGRKRVLNITGSSFKEKTLHPCAEGFENGQVLSLRSKDHPSRRMRGEAVGKQREDASVQKKFRPFKKILHEPSTSLHWCGYTRSRARVPLSQVRGDAPSVVRKTPLWYLKVAKDATKKSGDAGGVLRQNTG